MRFGLATVAIGAAVIIAFILAARSAGRHGVVLSRDEVARYIEDFLDGRADYRDWDEFTSMRIRDPDLDRIRQSCIGNETNPLVLRALLEEVRGRAA
jgi:hypothetical protein